MLISKNKTNVSRSLHIFLKFDHFLFDYYNQYYKIIYLHPLIVLTLLQKKHKYMRNYRFENTFSWWVLGSLSTQIAWDILFYCTCIIVIEIRGLIEIGKVWKINWKRIKLAKICLRHWIMLERKSRWWHINFLLLPFSLYPAIPMKMVHFVQTYI